MPNCEQQAILHSEASKTGQTRTLGVKSRSMDSFLRGPHHKPTQTGRHPLSAKQWIGLDVAELGPGYSYLIATFKMRSCMEEGFYDRPIDNSKNQVLSARQQSFSTNQPPRLLRHPPEKVRRRLTESGDKASRKQSPHSSKTPAYTT